VIPLPCVCAGAGEGVGEGLAGGACEGAEEFAAAVIGLVACPPQPLAVAAMAANSAREREAFFNEVISVIPSRSSLRTRSFRHAGVGGF